MTDTNPDEAFRQGLRLGSLIGLIAATIVYGVALWFLFSRLWPFFGS
jgi:hypothetical protein